MVHPCLVTEVSKLGVFKLRDTKVPHLMNRQHSCTEHFKLKVKEYIRSYNNKTLLSKPCNKETIAN